MGAVTLTVATSSAQLINPLSVATGGSGQEKKSGADCQPPMLLFAADGVLALLLKDRGLQLVVERRGVRQHVPEDRRREHLLDAAVAGYVGQRIWLRLLHVGARQLLRCTIGRIDDAPHRYLPRIITDMRNLSSFGAKA